MGREAPRRKTGSSRAPTGRPAPPAHRSGVDEWRRGRNARVGRETPPDEEATESGEEREENEERMARERMDVLAHTSHTAMVFQSPGAAHATRPSPTNATPFHDAVFDASDSTHRQFIGSSDDVSHTRTVP